MKKHLSVLGLYIRSTLLPMLALLLVTCGVQFFLFARKIAPELGYDAPPEGGYIPGLETMFGGTVIPIVAGAALLCLTVILCIPGTSSGSQTLYTMARLRIGEKTTYLWQAGYNTFAFLLFWLAEGLLAFGICAWYAAEISTATGQTLFLALYRDEFLHSLLPLHEASRIVRNIAFCIALGCTSAYYTYRQRDGKASYVVLFILAEVIHGFTSSMGVLGMDIFHTVLSLLFAGIVVAFVLTDRFAFLFEEEGGSAWTN